MMKHASEVFEEWLDWPGDPFEWRECQSPIEDDFFHELHKFASDQVALHDQYEIKTVRGTFRLDFLLRHRTTGRQIGIECDGKEFHSIARDSKRDSAIIQSGEIASIYRVAGKDCHYCSLDSLQLIAQMEPWVVCLGFHEQATFYPHPTTYRDDVVNELEGGYDAIMRTYLDYVEKDEDLYIECGCETECDCRYKVEVVESTKRTPTLVRYMSGRGHPSPFETPENLIPLPMPEWKVELAKALRAKGETGVKS